MEDLRIVSSEKCPLCGGDVMFGECRSCGYAIPDTEEISAVYDLSPDNVTFGETEVDDDEDDIPSILPPDTSVLPTAASHRRRKKSVNAVNAVNVAVTANTAAAASPASPQNAAFVPYTKPNYGNPPEQVTAVSDMSVRVVKAVSDFVVKNWWKFLLVAILPSVGYGFAFFYFVINMDKERKKDELFFAALVLLTTILMQAFNWDPTGFDIIIQYFIKGFLTRGRHYY